MLHHNHNIPILKENMMQIRIRLKIMRYDDILVQKSPDAILPCRLLVVSLDAA